MSATHIRVFDCGHTELLTPGGSRFVGCYKCDTIGIDRDYLKCSIPTCRNEAVRVVRYANGYVRHYCDDCTAMAELDEDKVLTERRFSELTNNDDV